jgi:hypothetical protein
MKGQSFCAFESDLSSSLFENIKENDKNDVADL